MQSRKLFSLVIVSCMLSIDILLPVVLAGHHGNRNQNGIELLLAAGILAKLLRKKGGGGGHHHHHHGHDHGHGHHGSGARMIEVVHVAPPMGGYSSPYPVHPAQSYETAYGGPSPMHGAQTPYGGHAGSATTTFSSSVEYPYAASHPLAMHHHMPYPGPPSAAAFIGYEPQPIAYGPPPPQEHMHHP
ncbi:hypothetical protein X975_05506, partial [Stegodyphus mimosarum]